MERVASLFTLLVTVQLASTGLYPFFAFTTALILCSTDLTRCWEHSSEILVHMDITGSSVAPDCSAAHA